MSTVILHFFLGTIGSLGMFFRLAYLACVSRSAHCGGRLDKGAFSKRFIRPYSAFLVNSNNKFTQQLGYFLASRLLDT